MPKLYCFGLGFTATRLALRCKAQGWSVAGTCRSAEKQSQLQDCGIETHLFDGGRPIADAEAHLADTTHLVVSVPPGGRRTVAAQGQGQGQGPEGLRQDADPVIDHHGSDIAKLTELAWLGYLSTTGVYGDHQGDWVDESAPLTPSGERGRRRVEAEAAWLSLWRDHGLPVHLFRLSGIYGPGRSAIDQVRQGRARRIDKPGQVFNRIHVDDIVAVLEASMARPHPGAAYNCADDEPTASEVVVAYACTLLEAPIPPLVPFDHAALTPMARSFYSDNKRLSNRRIKEELDVRLAYPSYREGLCAQLAAERSHSSGDCPSAPGRSGG